MASGRLLPLDDAFVTRLRDSLGDARQLGAGVHQHWRGLLDHFQGRSDFEITAYIAQNFNNHVWTGNEPWFRDPVIQQVFAGYDRAAFNASNGAPALDDEARSRYNPSNTFGRGHLFPALPVPFTGAPIITRQQFDALTPAERENYQLTSVFGGHRFQRVLDTRTPAVGGTPGLSANDALGTNAPPFDNSITDDPVDNNAGYQGQNQVTPVGTNVFAVPTPPSSGQAGTSNVQQLGQAGGTHGVPPALPVWYPTLPLDAPPPGTSSANQPGSNNYTQQTTPADPASSLANTGTPPSIKYPDLTNMSYDSILPVDGTNNPPATTGTPSTFVPQLPTPANTTATGGSISTPPTGGPKPPATSQPATTGVPSGGVPGAAYPGALPVTHGSGPGVPAPPSSGSVAPPGGAFPPPGGPGILPVTPGSTPAGPSQPPGPPGVPPGAPPADGSVPRPLQPSASDMRDSFTWRGQVQPPVGSRLRAAQILLDEGDVDREMHWERNVAEVHEFLNWLLDSDESPPIGPESTLLAQQLLEKIQAHNLFNETHYGPNTPNKVITSNMIPARKPRLKYNGKLPLVLGRDHNDQNHLLPWEFPTHPRAEMIVNDQWLTDVEGQAGLTELRSTRQAQLSQDEEAWWQLGQFDEPQEGNAALAQEDSFEQCIARDGVGFQGWVETRLEPNGSLSRTFYNGARVGNGKICYARERGVRRAGLQAALRQFSSNENTVANTPWRRVRLALSAEEVEIMRKNTGAGPARKYELPKLRPNQLERTDGKDDPQGFTANMAQFWADRNRDMATAREAVVSRLGFGLPPAAGQHAIRPLSVLPPISLWGAYVDSGLSAEDEYHRQMLREMRTTKELFDRERRIAPRRLLTQMDAVYQQGLQGVRATYIPDGEQNPRDVQFFPDRDLDANDDMRDLDKMEIHWIRFLLTQSITPEMTQELEPRASMFILFADKLARIFNDVSDPLFPCNGTKVSIEDLLDYMHDRTDGPVTRIKFYAHDVQMWLERLHSQGRCRYQEDWRCYGWVMRPIPTCHPEQLVRWTVPEDVGDLRPRDRNEDVVSAPRFDRLRTWHSLVRRGLQNSPLDQRVEQYFLGLAYRWGWYMSKLTIYQGGLEQTWKQKEAAKDSDEMSNAIGSYRAEFDRITQWDDNANNPLVRLVKATLPDRANDNTLTADVSLQLIRDNVIKEAVKNDSMLWPARSANNYLDPLDEKVRPKVWGWAKPQVRGKAKRFFSVNRWPVQLQTERRQGVITRDEDMDEENLWKPELEDPTPSKYYRPKARPYIDEKVQFRAGHRNFLIGDTPRQKQVVIDKMFAQMGRAMTIQRDGDADQDIPEPGIRERWQMWSDYLRNRFRGDDDDDDDDGNDDRYEEPGSRLRKFNLEDIPQSHDPRGETTKRAADEEGATQGGPKRRRRTGREGRQGAGRDDALPARGTPGVAPADVAAAATPAPAPAPAAPAAPAAAPAPGPAGPGVAGAAGAAPPNQRSIVESIRGINLFSRGRTVSRI